MSNFAFKCTKCNTVTYSNTTRRVSVRCSKCGAFSTKRSAKDDIDIQKIAEEHLQEIINSGPSLMEKYALKENSNA